ncbi:hypothetical protein PPSIR1_16090 [Plesiocystis pacifica SIR-1]|uniref:Uncharacterized protein n=1 Tax=Plesiocystis pacifica SIR-1 TaxID=391625 RepID=A6GAU6_9BACT|nr:hypothetical protein PPSIR1_16090 [Plesiocystis pacifica SIR-1]
MVVVEVTEEERMDEFVHEVW